MKLGLILGYSGAKLHIDIELVKEAERLGFDSVWTAEAWGSDAVTPLAWIAAQTSRIKLGTAIMQVPGRTPANAAMTGSGSAGIVPRPEEESSMVARAMTPSRVRSASENRSARDNRCR